MRTLITFKVLKNNILFNALYLFAFALAIVAGAWRLPAYTSRLPMMILLAIIDLYLFRHFCSPWLNFKPAMKKALAGLTALPSMLLIVFFFSMAFLTPLEWNPVLRTYWLGTAFSITILKALPLIVFLKIDIHKQLIGNQIARRFEFRYRFFVTLSLWFSIVAGIMLLLGITRWAYDYEIVKHEIVIESLPSAFNNYRIIQISDIHLGRYHSKSSLKNAMAAANSLKPDLIVFTGDLVNYATSEANQYRETLASLAAPDGVFAVLGNHDYGDYLRWPDTLAKEKNIKAMHKLLARCGWILLRNENRKITKDGSEIIIAGIDHWSPHRRFPVRYDLDRAMQDSKKDGFVILLAHDPVFWQKHVVGSKYKIDLTLSGHTHAFQIGLKLGGKNWSPPALIKKYWNGLYTENNAMGSPIHLYVNAGLGHIMYPGRIGMEPEITLIVLNSRKP